MVKRRKSQAEAVTSLSCNIRMFLVLLLAYLVQVSVMPYMRIGGITPSMIVVTIAVVTVAMGKIRAFWAGSFFGIVLEAMQPTFPLLNLMLYPISALLCSVLFSDKSVQQIDYERSVGKVGRNLTPVVRTPLCAMTIISIYEIVNIIYIYLRGTDLTFTHIGRGLLDVFLTTLLSLLLMIPIRALIGVRYEPEEEYEPQPYAVQTSSSRTGRRRL